MTKVLTGADWNRDGIIFWGEESTLDMIDILAVNAYGTSDNYGTANPNAPGPISGLSGTFLSTGFTLAWTAPSVGGAVDYYIVKYQGASAGTSGSVGYVKTYDSVELLENFTPYTMSASWQFGYSKADDDFPSEGNASFELNNDSKTFSPSYTGSPLNGEAIIGVPVKVQVENSSGTLERHWTGYVTNVLPKPTNKTRFTTVTASQGIDLLRKYPQRSGYITDTNAGSAIEFLLNDWLPPGRDGWILGTGSLGISSFVAGHTEDNYGAGLFTYPIINETWLTESDRQVQVATENSNVSSIIGNLVSIEEGLFWLDENNYVNFVDKEVLLQGFNSGGTVNIDSAAITGKYEYGESVGIYNIIKASYYEKEVQTAKTMYTWSDSQTVSAGGSATISLGTDDVDKYKITPIEISGGTVTYTGTITYSFEINDSYTGINCNIVNSGGTDAEVTYVSVTGDFLKSFAAIEVEARDNDSIALYGKREKSFDFAECPTEIIAQAFANNVLKYYKNPRGRFSSIEIVDKDSSWLDNMLNISIGDSMLVKETQTGETDGIYSYVIGKQFSWNPGLLSTKLILAEHKTNIYWILGNSTLEETTYL